MDWNIFFSTISQTAGAIVGIFSAFLITKIVSNQTTYSQKQDQAADYLAKSRKLANEASKRYFFWYGERKAADAIYNIREDYDQTKLIKNAKEYYSLVKFSPFESQKDTLDIIQNEIDKIIEEKRIKEESIQNQIKSLGAGGFITPAPVVYRMPPNKDLYDDIQKERELIDDLYVRIQFQAEINKNLLNDLKNNSESSSLISISIFSVILLFFCGVIYPLSFLPMIIGTEISLSISAFFDLLCSLKGALLVILSIIFGGLMIAFFCANKKLTYSAELKSELEKYSDMRNYSDYFKNYEDNKVLDSK